MKIINLEFDNEDEFGLVVDWISGKGLVYFVGVHLFDKSDVLCVSVEVDNDDEIKEIVEKYNLITNKK